MLKQRSGSIATEEQGMFPCSGSLPRLDLSLCRFSEAEPDQSERCSCTSRVQQHGEDLQSNPGSAGDRLTRPWSSSVVHGQSYASSLSAALSLPVGA